MISVDWKWLVQLGLLGSSDWEQYAILLVRVSLGLFFAISGATKLFVSGRRQAMYETLVKAAVPFPRLMTYFVSGVDCRLSTGSTISSTFRKSCTRSSSSG